MNILPLLIVAGLAGAAPLRSDVFETVCLHAASPQCALLYGLLESSASPDSSAALACSFGLCANATASATVLVDAYHTAAANCTPSTSFGLYWEQCLDGNDCGLAVCKRRGRLQPSRRFPPVDPAVCDPVLNVQRQKILLEASLDCEKTVWYLQMTFAASATLFVALSIFACRRCRSRGEDAAYERLNGESGVALVPMTRTDSESDTPPRDTGFASTPLKV
jgi:hypothetical protein